VDIARNRLNYCIRLWFHQVTISGQHYPHRAPGDLIDKYEGVYDAGWDELRTRRYARQVDLGVMPPGLALFASDSL
jgi:hypothetical protein